MALTIEDKITYKFNGKIRKIGKIKRILRNNFIIVREYSYTNKINYDKIKKSNIIEINN